MEEGDWPQHVTDLFEQRLSGIETDARNEARTQEIIGGHRPATCRHAELGEAVEDDAGEQREVADDEGEEADIEHLFEESGDDVGVLAERPEQACQRDVDGDERGRQIGDIARQQAEAAVDIGDESRKECVDHVHWPLFSEEGSRPRAAPFGFGELAGALQCFGAVMGRHHGFHLHELLGLQGLDLVAGLGDLEIADGGLAVGDQAVEAFTVGPGG